MVPVWYICVRQPVGHVLLETFRGSWAELFQRCVQLGSLHNMPGDHIIAKFGHMDH